MADSPGARHLPVLVLLRIFSHLPLCALSRCAQVCRHWHDCLPAPEVRLSRWLRQHAPLSCLAAANPGQSIKHRTLSFLQAARSPLVPALMHLHQQQPAPLFARRQDSGASPPPAAGPQLLPALLHYGLNRHFTEASQLTLTPLPLDWPDQDRVLDCIFSPCSHWLALLYTSGPAAPWSVRLYGWKQSLWQECPLVPAMAEPVKLICFA